MSTDATGLFTTFDINGVTLGNRLAVAPMTRVSASDEGTATETMARYYERFARGGFGLLITEGIYTDRAFSQGYLHQPGITDEAQEQAWRPVVEAAHRHGAHIFAQLMHAGAISQGNRFRETSIGPSAVQPKGEQMEFYYGKGAYPAPEAMNEEQIADAIEGFAASAARAVAAGFDGIEIHGANGYLIDQFLTDYANRRRDRWGGDTRQRTTFVTAIVEAVRAKAGPGVPVGVRISQGKVNDYAHKWPGREQDAEVIFGTLAEAGISYLHVTEHRAWEPAFKGGPDSLVALARRYAPQVPLIANGGVQDRARAQEVLAAGADIVALGKAALANPDFPNRIQAAQELAGFDHAILGPIANIKPTELAA
ncbi:2,4-dienoyl-CoA reductase-like NADH-dependent reductase (Old Yellow Enzyme family) [Methylobacterium sp. BE186]|uniref:NADH:flavin oxidoreductase n=1 Tax=Methylobacterium sp. BE186 TaxID=2817715 RepID=UPI0028657EA7|nr:NADH:flavin oxidoreductase [Methylobacterium sp. BE186]MDR7037949.1 2,4-dienoyl-CoA reductase-like NADH-dependent reductase (Old Yellow Enzyme family) [Methylobacterium sp. BE186]